MDKEIVKGVADQIEDRKEIKRRNLRVFLDAANAVFVQECRLRGLSDTDIIDYLLAVWKESCASDPELYSYYTEDLLEGMEAHRDSAR